MDGREPVSLFTCKEICSNAGIVAPQLSGIDPVKLLEPRSISTVKGEKVAGNVPVSRFTHAQRTSSLVSLLMSAGIGPVIELRKMIMT